MNNVRIPFQPIMSISMGIAQAILFLEAGLQVILSGFLHHKDSIVSHEICVYFWNSLKKYFAVTSP